MSGTKKIPNTQTTASKLASLKGRLVMSPDRNSVFVRPCCLALVRANSSKFSAKVYADYRSFWSNDLRRGNRRSSTSTTHVQYARSWSESHALDGSTSKSLPETIGGMIEVVRGCVVSRGCFLFGVVQRTH